ncbi:MAG: maltodextrin glucosidase [Candidatus Hodarchaeales archaeon]
MISKVNWQETIHSDGSEEFISPGNPQIGDLIKIRIRMFKNSPIKDIFLCIAPEGEEINLKMEVDEETDFFRYFAVNVRIESKIFHYQFIVQTENRVYWYTSLGLSPYPQVSSKSFKIIANFEEPSWVKRSIFYQIFPDRFYDGDPSNNVKTGEYTYRGQTTVARKWGENPKSDKGYSHVDFYGGDLAGIRKKISYLKELGVNALYLNPIFKSYSNHKYDVVSFKTIDEHLGTNEGFAELVKELHSNDIKIILDGVFNHTGVEHDWFIKAKRNPNSQYAGYYTFHDHPEKYVSWLGYKILPKLNYQDEGLKKEIYKKTDSVVQFWLKPPYLVDGWRVDVANMLSRQGDFQNHLTIWQEIRAAVKNCNSEVYLMGEHFFDATELLDGTRLDGVMNYRGFYQPVTKWLLKKETIGIIDEKKFSRKTLNIEFSAFDLHQQLSEYLAIVPFQIQLLQYNLLNSHDLPRFITLANNNMKILELGLFLLFTYIGVPSIYYGDEIGLEGGRDPDCRRCMIWDESQWNHKIRELYKKLIKIRRSFKSLQEGSYKVLLVDNELFCFVRFLKDEFVLAIMNNNRQSQSVKIPLWKVGFMTGRVINLISEKEYEANEGFLEIAAESYQGLLLSNQYLVS